MYLVDILYIYVVHICGKVVAVEKPVCALLRRLRHDYVYTLFTGQLYSLLTSPQRASLGTFRGTEFTFGLEAVVCVAFAVCVVGAR